jgi:hypothetical protein
MPQFSIVSGYEVDAATTGDTDKARGSITPQRTPTDFVENMEWFLKGGQGSRLHIRPIGRKQD